MIFSDGAKLRLKKKPPPSYTVEDLSRAILNHNKSYSEVEQCYGIPKSVVFNRIEGRKSSASKIGAGRALTLGVDVERALENCIKARARMGCPCSKTDIREVVTEYKQLKNTICR